MNLLLNLGKYVTKKWFFRDARIIIYGVVPLHNPAIIVANHGNPWDPPLIMLSVRRNIVHFFTAKYLFRGVTGIFLRLVKQIPVQSGLKQLNKEAFKKANKYLNDGELIGIFPYPYDIIKKKKILYAGVIRLIIENDVPIIPVKVELNETKQSNSYFDVNFNKATIKIGVPIRGFRNRCIRADKKNYKKLARLLLKKIEML